MEPGIILKLRHCCACCAAVFFNISLAAWVCAQEYATDIDEYAPLAKHGFTPFEKAMKGPAASLIMVLVGASGIFNLFFSPDKGEASDRKKMLGFICLLAVFFMCWYRFSLWNKDSK